MTVDSLIDKNSIITGSNNITPGTFNVKPYGYDKMYIDKDLIGKKLHQLIDQSTKEKLIIEIFIMHYLMISIHLMIGELVRYYLLAISVKSSIGN